MGKRVLIALGSLVALYLAYVIVLCFSISSSGSVDETRKADCILVMWMNFGSYEDRVKHAIELYKRQEAPYIIFTSSEYHEGHMGMRMALQSGVPVDAMVHLPVVESEWLTDPTLRAATHVMATQGWKSYLISAEPFNIPKLKKLARQYHQATPYASPVLPSDGGLWRAYYTLMSAVELSLPSP